jgi:pyruvate carboxylase subunit B
MWGGATFDVAHRFLREDPWERVKVLKRLMPELPFRCFFGARIWWLTGTIGRSGAFVEKSAEVEIDIFRCFDAVNDERNFETAFKVLKWTYGMAIGCYTKEVRMS